MEIRKGLNHREKMDLAEHGCFVMDYTVNGEVYTYIVHPVTERSYEE